jgi:outer membrane lipoprotein carrier protein
MEVRDAFGRVTQFTFSRIERNAAIDPAQFRFVAPAGAEVVRQ